MDPVEPIEVANGSIGTEQAMEMLAGVSQWSTQWSVVYGISSGSAQVAVGTGSMPAIRF